MWLWRLLVCATFGGFEVPRWVYNSGKHVPHWAKRGSGTIGVQQQQARPHWQSVAVGVAGVATVIGVEDN